MGIGYRNPVTSSGMGNCLGPNGKWRERSRMCIFFALALFLFGTVVWLADVSAKQPAPAPVVAEFAEAQIEMYEAMLAPSRVTLRDMTNWSDAERVVMTAAALGAVTEPTSLATWKPGFEEYLRTVLGYTDEGVVDAVYAVYGARSAWMANNVFAQMSKPE